MNDKSESDKNDVVSRLVARVAEVAAVERVFLFGSRARGDHDERSDYDLAVEAPGAGASEWAAVQEIVETAPTLAAIDLVRFDEAGEELRERILSEGQVIYERDEATTEDR